MTEERFLLPMSPPKVGVVMPLASVIVPLPEVSSALFCRARLLAKTKTPAVMLVFPLKVFMPESVTMDDALAEVATSPPVPEITPLKVRLFAEVLFWLFRVRFLFSVTFPETIGV